jgi:asparagine synthase (glutamine-hydrolysing)
VSPTLESDLAAPLTLLEIAAGTVLEPAGLRGRRPARGGARARSVLEAVARAALASGPVFVSFSGGRDSSLVLAVTAAVARREGLPEPVPVTARHSSAESQEEPWQHLVVTHLGLREWVRIDVADRMDVLGVEATSLLARAGLVAPANAYLHLPMAQVAAGGTLLTGVGGDELLGSQGNRLARAIYAGGPLRARELRTLALAASPEPLRRRWRRRDGYPWAPWLRPDAARLVKDRVAASEAATRVRWDVDAIRYGRSRAVRLGREALETVGRCHGARIVSPLLDPDFVVAFAREMGPAGPPSRTASMRHLASDLLPDAALTRASKAVFAALVWGPRFREFAASWSGGDLSPELRSLVDPFRLRENWEGVRPLFPSMLLLQHVWLCAHARSATGELLDEREGRSQRVP